MKENYFPIIPLCKSGVSGLLDLTEDEIEKTFPVFVLSKPHVDAITLEEQYSIEEHVTNQLKLLSILDERGIRYGVQFSGLMNEIEGIGAGQDLILARFFKLKSNVSPVLSINGPSLSTNEVDVIKRFNYEGRWIFRLTLSNRGASIEELSSWLDGALEYAKVDSREIALVLDLGNIGGWQSHSSISGVEVWIRALSQRFAWNKVVIAASSLSGMYRSNTANVFPVIREEWMLYVELRKRFGTRDAIAFSDFSVFDASSFYRIPLSSSELYFPYSGENSWYVFKSDASNQPLISVCRNFVDLLTSFPSVFKEPGFSLGDKRILELKMNLQCVDNYLPYVELYGALASHHTSLVLRQLI